MSVVDFRSHSDAPLPPDDRQVALAAFRAGVFDDAAAAISATINAAMARQPLVGKLGYDDILPILAAEMRRQLGEVCGPAEGGAE